MESRTQQNLLSEHQLYYEQLLSANNLPSLQSQKQNVYTMNTQNKSDNDANNSINMELFPKTDNYPQFFNENLLSPNRIIKVVHGDYCILRAFYFQLFKLLFQIQNEERDYLEIFKEIIFNPNLFTGVLQNSRVSKVSSQGAQSRVSKTSKVSKVSSNNSSRVHQLNNKQQNIKKCQKMLAQFIEKILNTSLNYQSQQQIQGFQQILLQYPVIDQIMILLLEQFMEHCNQQLQSVKQILQYLCQIFEIQLISIDNWFRFQESDVFFYLEQKKIENTQDDQIWIYIAYNQPIEDLQQNKFQQEQIVQNTSRDQQEYRNNEQNIKYNANKNPNSGNENYHAKKYQLQISQKKPSSSSYKDMVITSEMNDLSSKKNNLTDFYSSEKKGQQKKQTSNSFKEANYEHRPNRTKSYQQQNQIDSNDRYNGCDQQFQQNYSKLSKSNQLPNSNSVISQLPANTAQKNVYMSIKNDSENKLNCHRFDQIIQSNESDSNALKEIKRKQSQTQAYRQQNFKNKQSSKQSINISNNYPAQIDSSIAWVIGQENWQKFKNSSQSFAIQESPKICDSKTDTIINMLGGDVFKSSHGFPEQSGIWNDQVNSQFYSQSQSQLFVGQQQSSQSNQFFNGFSSVNNFFVEPQHDNEDQIPKNASVKNSQIKKTSYKNPYGVSQDVDPTIKYNMTKKARSQQQIIFEAKQSEEDLDGFDKKSNQTKHRNPSVISSSKQNKHTTIGQTMHFSTQSQKKSKENQLKSFDLDNFQLKSRKSSERGNKIEDQLPYIQINNVNSQNSSQASRESRRNNYYQKQDYISHSSRNKKSQQIIGKPKESVQLKGSHDKNLHLDYQDKAKVQKLEYKSKPFNYRSYQNIDSGRTLQDIDQQAYFNKNSNMQSRAFTHSYAQNKDRQSIKNDNQEEQDDIFYRPSNQDRQSEQRSKQKNLLNTISEVGASKESNKDSKRFQQNKTTLNYESNFINIGKTQEQTVNGENYFTSKFQTVNSIIPTNYEPIEPLHIDSKYKQFFTKGLKSSNIGNSRISGRQSKVQNYQDSINQSKGTFYKQFTNSKVMKLLKQPYRTKVEILKGRFKGQHRTKRSNVGGGFF